MMDSKLRSRGRKKEGTRFKMKRSMKSSSTETLGDLRRDRQLLDWVELPLWRQVGNAYIESGYRPSFESILDCYRSWGYLHNETVNIWSHVFGAALFAALPVYLFTTEVPPRYIVATTADLVVFTLYLVGVSICFLLSATFHTIMCQSSLMFHIGVQLDFEGIILLMWSATVPLIYYGFYCDPTLQRVYWVLLSVFGLACSIFTFQPRFRDPHLRPLRALTFGSFGVSNIIPVAHATIKYGWTVQAERMGLVWVIITLIFNIIGATAYATKFPEKWWRRTFDMFGASHQILHIAVIVAGLTFTIGLLQAFDFLHSQGDTCVRNM